MVVYRLLRDELVYELKIRALSQEGNVAELRKRLAKALAARINPVEKEIALLNEQTELGSCETKLGDLSAAVEVLDIGDANEVRRLEIRLDHIRQRLERVTTSEEFLPVKEDLIASADGLITELSSKRKGNPVTEITVENQSSTSQHCYKAEQDDKPQHMELSAARSAAKDLRLYKWGLTFSGEDPGQSLGAFLAEVEDRRVARGISKPELFSSASELFKGTALVWYRTKREKLQTWDELVQGLRKTFLDVDYDHQLKEEIRQRTQGPQENPAVYIAKMKGLFSRLTSPVSEGEKLDIITRNVKKDYRPLLPLTSFKTLDQLEDVLQGLEIGAIRASRYEEPPVRGNLEPELAYKGPRSKMIRASPLHTPPARANDTPRERSTPKKIKCWRCHQFGHVQRECTTPNRPNPGTSADQRNNYGRQSHADRIRPSDQPRYSKSGNAETDRA